MEKEEEKERDRVYVGYLMKLYCFAAIKQDERCVFLCLLRLIAQNFTLLYMGDRKLGQFSAHNQRTGI